MGSYFYGQWYFYENIDFNKNLNPRQPNKMVKHTQTLRRLLPTNYLSVFDHFVELPRKGLIRNLNYHIIITASETSFKFPRDNHL